jgi:hypothetical protein
MEQNHACRKNRKLGTLIPVCGFVRNNLDLDKATGNQGKIEYSKSLISDRRKK